jgi:hypothetical protein
MYFRVFSLSDATPDLATMLEYLHAAEMPVIAHFRGDDLGWTGGELVFADKSVTVERYLTKEDDLRDELNTWAGWLETRTEHSMHGRLMQHLIGTKQMVTLRVPADSTLDRLCDEICRWLARQTDGIYQVDGLGFFAADGTMVLPEQPTAASP